MKNTVLLVDVKVHHKHYHHQSNTHTNTAF